MDRSRVASRTQLPPGKGQPEAPDSRVPAVTAPTGCFVVGTDKFKGRSAVVEGGLHTAAPDPHPSRGLMAALTRPLHSPPMGILVARTARPSFNRTVPYERPRPFPPFRLVATLAVHLPVGSFEAESRLGMVEARGSAPLLFVVTRPAVLVRELICVRVIHPMAAPAVGGQPEEGTVEGTRRRLEVPHFGIDHESGLVAGHALRDPVPPTKPESGGVMGEFFRQKMRAFETFSQVFLVAAPTFRFGEGSVISASLPDPLRQGLMTSEAPDRVHASSA